MREETQRSVTTSFINESEVLLENTKTDTESKSRPQTANAKTASVRETLEKFLESPDFKRGIIDATKAAHTGIGYSVELLPEQTWKVIENSQLGARDGTRGILLDLPILRMNDTRSGHDEHVLGDEFAMNENNLKEILSEALDSFNQK